MSEITDQQLVSDVLNGDKQAFAKIIQRHQQLVATTAMGMLGDVNDAEEIGQQTFIRLYKALSKFEQRSKLSTYINRICINLCLNQLKRRRRDREKRVDLDYQKVIAYGLERDFEQRDSLHKALGQLRPKERSIIVLRLLEGYSTKETAEILAIAEGTVLSRLKRAKDRLKEILKTYGYE